MTHRNSRQTSQNQTFTVLSTIDIYLLNSEKVFSKIEIDDFHCAYDYRNSR